MTDLIPVDFDPFAVKLEPVDFDPWAAAGTPGPGQMTEADRAQVMRAADMAGGGLLRHFMTPGNVMQGVQTETPGVMTEADAYRQNQLEDQARNFGTQQAFNTVFGNVPMSQAGALGVGGGKLSKVAEDYIGEHSSPGPGSGSPLHDVTLNGTYPKDFYGPSGLRYYAPGHEAPGLDASTYSKIRELKDKPDEKVKIYRAIPWQGKSPGYTLNSGGPGGGVINPGDWVSITRQYAKDHGESALNGNYAIVGTRVPAKELYTAGDSYHEWGWHPDKGAVTLTPVEHDPFTQ